MRDLDGVERLVGGLEPIEQRLPGGEGQRAHAHAQAASADDFLQPLGHGLEGGSRVAAFQRAGILDVLLAIGTFRREADVVGEDAGSGVKPLQEVPDSAGVIELGLLVPARGK